MDTAPHDPDVTEDADDEHPPGPLVELYEVLVWQQAVSG